MAEAEVEQLLFRSRSADTHTSLRTRILGAVHALEMCIMNDLGYNSRHTFRMQEHSIYDN